MTSAALLALPVLSCAAALVVAVLSPAHTLAPRLALMLQAPFVVYMIYLVAFALPQADGGLVDASGVWISVGDLFVETSFHFGVTQACLCSVVLLVTALCLWWSFKRASDASSMLPAHLLAVQASLWLCILCTDLPLALAGFVLAGFALPRAPSPAADVAQQPRFGGFHRAADGFAMCAALVWLLWSPSLSAVDMVGMQSAPQDELLAPVLGLSASPWLIVMLSLALALRTVGVGLAQERNKITWSAGGLVVLTSAAWVCRYVPLSRWWAPLLALALGVGSIYALRSALISIRVWPSLHKPLQTFGLTVATTQKVLGSVVLHTPTVAADVLARMLKLLAGGDIQRYVAIGLIGLAGLVFVATSPASPNALTIHTDGLRVSAIASRGPVSSRRLLYDYDFDGDAQIDRVAAGPIASFTYAAAGTYSVSVTIRDPLWHTRRTLQARVLVHP